MIPESPVPTAQRPINGAVSGGTAIGIDALSRYLLAGLIPAELAMVAAPVLGIIFSSAFAVIGDVCRSRLVASPPTSILGEIVLKIGARIG